MNARVMSFLSLGVSVSLLLSVLLICMSGCAVDYSLVVVPLLRLDGDVDVLSVSDKPPPKRESGLGSLLEKL